LQNVTVAVSYNPEPYSGGGPWRDEGGEMTLREVGMGGLVKDEEPLRTKTTQSTFLDSPPSFAEKSELRNTGQEGKPSKQGPARKE